MWSTIFKVGVFSGVDGVQKLASKTSSDNNSTKSSSCCITSLYPRNDQGCATRAAFIVRTAPLSLSQPSLFTQVIIFPPWRKFPFFLCLICGTSQSLSSLNEVGAQCATLQRFLTFQEKQYFGYFHRQKKVLFLSHTCVASL